MPKKIKCNFDEYITFPKFLSAYKRAKLQKTYKKEVIEFEINLENNLTNLMRKIQNGTYRLGNYYQFTIYEPKERVIKALPFVDRIVHQWYVEEFIKPYIVPKFISTSFACLTGKGTHKAVDELQKQMKIMWRNNGNFWVLKCDVKKFFNSINPNILFNIMKKHIKNKKLLEFTKLLIFCNLPANNIGIPIGNYTSQFFANIYLNELDYYVKRTLKIHHYVRYMDDFILLLKSKEECRKIKKLIESFLKNNLSLELNDKSRYYPSSMGVNFCGYRIFTTHKLLRVSSKKKIKSNVKKWNKLWKKNKLDFKETSLSLNSWLGHASHCNSYNLRQKIINRCEFLYKEQ